MVLCAAVKFLSAAPVDGSSLGKTVDELLKRYPPLGELHLPVVLWWKVVVPDGQYREVRIGRRLLGNSDAHHKANCELICDNYETGVCTPPVITWRGSFSKTIPRRRGWYEGARGTNGAWLKVPVRD